MVSRWRSVPVLSPWRWTIRLGPLLDKLRHDLKRRPVPALDLRWWTCVACDGAPCYATTQMNLHVAGGGLRRRSVSVLGPWRWTASACGGVPQRELPSIPQTAACYRGFLSKKTHTIPPPRWKQLTTHSRLPKRLMDMSQ